MTEHTFVDPWQRAEPLAPGPAQTILDGLWRRNPIAVGLLGICSALAVTTRLESAIVMSVAVIFVCTMSNFVISLIRGVTPARIRLIAWITLIGTFVIVVDQLTKAFYYEISLQLGPYVGLIITNCIILGRAEAFASRHRPALSALDGVANGVGYGIVLCLVASIRELLGTGQIALMHLGGKPVTLVTLGERYLPNDLLLMSAGAFITLGFLVALFNACRGRGDADG